MAFKCVRPRLARLQLPAAVTALVAIVAAPAAPAAPVFESLFETYTVGSQPRFAVSADFDADSRLDVAVTTFDPGTVTLLAGAAPGRFEVAGQYPIETYARALRSADFDADGRMDLIVAGATRLRVFHNTGTGRAHQFTSRDLTGDFSDRRDLVVGDFNGDRQLDFVVMEQAGLLGRASFWRGSGGAQFAPPLSSDFNLSIGFAAAGDFDADGALDIAASGDGQLVVLFGRGDGTFGVGQRLQFGRDAGPVVTGDWNGDGAADLAMGGDSGRVTVLMGTIDGGVNAGWRDAGADFPVTSIATSDANGDGSLDLVVVRQAANRIDVLGAQGNGVFARTGRAFAGSAPLGIALADFDADGRIDAAVPNSGARTVAVLLNRGPGLGVNAPLEMGPDPTGLASADLNGDGSADLVTLHPAVGDIAVRLGASGGVFAARRTQHLGGAPASMALGDVNGDTRPDLIYVDPVAERIDTCLGAGDGTFGAPNAAPVAGHPTLVWLADLDADGHLDVITSEPGGAEGALHILSVLRGRGDGSFAAPYAFELPSGAASVAVTDYDGDGVRDLVAGCYDAGVVAALRGNGDATFQPARTTAVGDHLASVAAADLDGDGRDEFVVAHSGRSGVTVLRAVGGALAVDYRVVTDGSARFVAAHDFDADGRIDVAVVRAPAGQVVVVPGGPLLAWDRRVDIGTGDVSSVVIADANGDGLPDLLYTDAVIGSVVVLHNVTPLTPVSVEDFAVERQASACDLVWRLAPAAMERLARVDVERSPAAAGPWATLAQLEPATGMHYRDATVGADGDLWYRLRLVGKDGSASASAPLGVRAAIVHAGLDAVGEHADGSVDIAFTLAQAQEAHLTAFDVRGRALWRWRRVAAPGQHLVAWDRRDVAGGRAVRGAYFVRLETGGRQFVRKVILVHS